MRKGRSQRKTRGSLPPLSSRSHGGTGLVGAGPQVVVGHAAPTRGDSHDSHDSHDSPPPPPPPPPEMRVESREAKGSPAGAPSLPTVSPKALEIPAESEIVRESLELVCEAERLELVREQSLEIVRESLELVRESLAHERSDSDTEPTPEVVPRFGAPASLPATSFELIESEPAPAVRSRGARRTSQTSQTSVLTPDEISIPPAGDLAVEPIADQFFSEGEILAAGAGAIEDDDAAWDHAADKGKRKSLPHVIERRARFSKYVRWAVGGAAIVCLAALGRTVVVPSAASRVSDSRPAGAAVTAIEAPAPATKAATPAVLAAAAPAAPVAAAAAPGREPGTVEAPKVAIPSEPAAVAVPAAPPAAEVTKPAVATGDKTALQEKNDARRALERGKSADAIAAGERSVALDPTDGEAWLLLGAAYQDKGKNAEARRCYTACTKEGKRGPIGECRAMLH